MRGKAAESDQQEGQRRAEDNVQRMCIKKEIVYLCVSDSTRGWPEQKSFHISLSKTLHLCLLDYKMTRVRWWPG